MRHRVTLVGLLQAAAALTVVFSVATMFDSLHHGIELFSHFRLQYLLVSMLLAVTFGVLRGHAYSAVLLLTSALNAFYVLPWYLADTSEFTDGSIRILHANVHSSSTDYQSVLDLVEDESPEIIFLQEVTNAWAIGIQALSSDYAYHYAEPREGNFGIAVFSRIPLDSVTHVDSPPFGYPTIIAEANVAGQTLTLISTHPTIPLGRRGYESRNLQLDHVATLVAASRGPTILIGDLNASMFAHSYRSFLEKSGLRDGRRGFGVLPTWPTFMPFAMIPIDHALVSDDLDVFEMRTGSRVGSDHLPLIVTVAL